MAELRADPRFTDVFTCSEHTQAFDAAVTPRLREMRKEPLVFGCQKQRVPAGFVNDLREILDDPQYRDRGFWTRVDHPAAGAHVHAGFPVRMSDTPPIARRAPLLGEHDAAILGELA